VVRTDAAGATHEVMAFCREHRLRYSAGFELTEPVRTAILKIPETAWVSALASDGSERENGQIAEITMSLDLTGWATGSRVIVRRERAHPGAQLSFTDHDGHRFQAVLTDQSSPHIQILERRQRERAHAETQIRNDKDTGLRNLPFRDFEHNRVWLKLVGIAHDLLVWIRRLLLLGELARCEPKRLRYRLLHLAARLAFHAAKPRSASTPHGRGHKRSPTHSSAPKRSPHPPDSAAGRARRHRTERQRQRHAQGFPHAAARTRRDPRATRQPVSATQNRSQDAPTTRTPNKSRSP
jgi:hypothetical protein